MALSTLLYASSARSGITDKDIDDIVATARAVNAELDVTGILAFDGNGFAQILEGEDEVIKTLYEKIERDRRHFGCVLLSYGEIDRRRFEDWTMAYRQLSDLIMIQDVTV